MKINLKKVSPETRHYIKTQVINLREQGRKNREIAEILNVPACTVANITYYYKIKGVAFLQEKKRGRKTGEKRTLSPEQERMIYEIINSSTPEQNKIASCLWGRPAIQQLIKQKLDIEMPIRTITGYMKRWKMSCKRPVRKNYKQNNKKVEEFKNRTYPEIVQKAKEEKAEILFVDETGINNQEYRMRGFSPIGYAPVVGSVSHRESINMISAISIEGTCRYMCYETSMTQQRFISFMYLITRAKKARKILVITDNLKIHHGLQVQKWLAERKDKIELFFFPAYTPELNPDEYLNNVLKQNVHTGILPKTKDDIKKLITLCKI